MDSIEVQWNGEGIREVCKSESVKQSLLTKAKQQAQLLSSEGAQHLHSPMREQLYVAEVRELDNTAVAVIHAKTKAGAAINRKYNVLHW